MGKFWLICLTVILFYGYSESQIEHDGVKKDWWEYAVFYQISPRSFKDSNNDGIGDLKGITSKLQHLKDSGVQATWLSPIFKSPQKDFGYDIQDFFNVDEIFGSMADLEEMITEAHRLGMKVIMDFVPNHSSSESEWFIKSENREAPYTDYYVWRDGKDLGPGMGRKAPPNNWQSVFYGSAWTWSDKRQQYYLHQFDKTQPDLDYRQPLVVEKMKEVLRFWMDKGADGFRVDAINHLFEVEDLRDEPRDQCDDPESYCYTQHIYTKDLLETYDMIGQWRKVLDDYTLEHGTATKVIFTEAYANISFTMKYYQQDNGQPLSHFPFNFNLIDDNLEWDKTAANIKSKIDSWLNNMPSGKTANWVIGNHDKPRVASRFGKELVDGMAMLVMTLPGVAVTYNGEEIGMVDYREITWDQTQDPQACNTNNPNDYKWASRDPQRTPFQWDSSNYGGFSTARPWIPMHPDYASNTLEMQKNAAKSNYKFYQQMTTLRQHHTFIFGTYKSRAFNDKVFGYVRELDGMDTFVVIMNLENTPYTINIEELYNPIDKDMETVVEAAGSLSRYNTDDEIKDMRRFEVGQYEAVVLRMRSAANAVTLSLTLMLVTLAKLFVF